jgi:hypothetical protein
MATLNIADILDHLVVVTEEARITAKPNKRWSNALNFAYGWIIEQDTVEYDEATHELLVPSANTPGLTYRANGSCQCAAYNAPRKEGEPRRACWHRAAAKLVKNALERQQRCEAQDRAQREQEARAERRAVTMREVAELWA